ncbi:MAG: hypothetical protein HPY69_05680 [Armatimonadetes bacterium]|nr:hypothetical protein [Armatimonadota bacterium]
MSRDEIIEWAVILLSVVLWWPRLFLGYDPLWYHLLIYYAVPVALIVIFVRRFRRMRAGLEYSEKVVQSQRYGQPPPSLDEKEGRRRS